MAGEKIIENATELPKIPEVDRVGIVRAVDIAASALAKARKLHERADADPEQESGALMLTRQANAASDQALMAAQVLDLVLPLAEDSSWLGTIETLASTKSGSEEA